MRDLFISRIQISKIRHLKNVGIALSETERKHLILTGKNGSGKTSVLEAIKDAVLLEQINSIPMDTQQGRYFNYGERDLKTIKSFASGIKLIYSVANPDLGATVFAYLPTNRKQLIVPKSIESMDVQGKTIITRNASAEFLKYILSLDYQLYGAKMDGNTKLKDSLEKWFDNFRDALRNIYGCPELKLNRDTKRLVFNIQLPEREPFGLHEMSDGYTAFLDVYMELLMRLEIADAVIEYEKPAIVLIDEMEAHLHVELQKRALPFLTKMFPKIQFIVATHSPFVITSLDNAVVFDLEKNEVLEYPSLYSYESVVKSFLDTNSYSQALIQYFQRYKELCFKERTTEENDEFLRAKAELELMSPASKELHLAFKDLETKRKAKKSDKIE